MPAYMSISEFLQHILTPHEWRCELFNSVVVVSTCVCSAMSRCKQNTVVTYAAVHMEMIRCGIRSTCYSYADYYMHMAQNTRGSFL